MWRLCCAGQVSHEPDEYPVSYGSIDTTNKVAIEANGIENKVAAEEVEHVSCKKRTESESSVEQEQVSGQAKQVPAVKVEPPKDKLSPKTASRKPDTTSLASYKSTTHSGKVTLLDLAQGRFSDVSDASDNDVSTKQSGKTEKDDKLNDIKSNSLNRKKGPSKLSDSRESILSIYSDAGEVNYGKIPITGDILFGLSYDEKEGLLQVNIQECRDIAAVDTKNNRSDPYVKTYLLPDKSRASKKKTKIKKHTLNPVFDEALKYAVTKTDLETRSLWITVWNHDTFGRNDFLGEVLIPFEGYEFTDGTPEWYRLQERLLADADDGNDAQVEDKGDLLLSIKYISPDKMEQESPKKSKKKKTSEGELHVLIREAQNLTGLRSNGTSDPFCKGYLLPDKNKTGKQKTSVVKKNCSPVWNQLFIFDDVKFEDLTEKSLELTIWDHDTLSSNDFLGGCRFNMGTGTHGGKEVDWMDAMGEEIATWQAVVQNPNTFVDVAIKLRSSMGANKVKK